MRLVMGAVVACALALSGCTTSDGSSASASATAGDISLIEVGVSESLAPSVSWPVGTQFTRSQTEVLWEGDGAALEDGQPLLLDIFVQSIDTGDVLKNTYNGLPESTILAPELLGDSLYALLLNATVGTRVLSVSMPEGEFEDEPAIVVVIDVLSDRAVGDSLDQNPDLPRVSTLSTGEPVVELEAEQTLPKDLTVSTLIQGHGPQVLVGSYVVAQFKAVYAADGAKDGKFWKLGDIRQSSWPAERRPFEGQVGVGKLPRAWDEGLVDQTVGSRVLIVAPEAWGYPGEGTLLWVVDILDVWNDVEGTADQVLDLPDVADVDAAPTSPTAEATP